MTIVASNSFTLSNVNDGSITHAAWSYSADGTDGFTTVYPNLNLLNKGFNLNIAMVGTGENNYNQGGPVFYINSGLYMSQLFNIGDIFTVSFSFKVESQTASGQIMAQINGGNWATYAKADISPSESEIVLTQSIVVDETFITSNKNSRDMKINLNKVPTSTILTLTNFKLEIGNKRTPWMQSASEVTTADWPKYIGHYTDFMQADSTNPSDYTWGPMRGNDGVGIKTTGITYAISTSGTTAPSTGWISAVPSLVKGQYLWTKTVWTYTDNSSETGYSVTYISKDGNNGTNGIAGKDGTGIKTTTITYAGSTSGTTAPSTGWTTTVPTVAAGSYLWTKTVWAYTDNTSETGYSVAKMGNTGPTGPAGPPGSNGDPGKIVSDTEPTTRFKGLTWKYLGTSDLTASDGTVILSGTEYYWSGTNWILSEINAHNINGDNLNVTNGTFTDGVIETSWKNGTVAGSTNIEKDHLIITRTDSSVNTTNSIGLDSTQGLIMVYTENSTGRTISVGTNFQGMFLTDSTGISASISPAGVKLSSDVNWTQIGNIGGRRAEWKRENNRVTMNIHGGNGDGFPVVTSGGTLLGILPTNARPPSDISMPATAQGAGATAQISINSTGEVRCYRWGGDSVYFGAYISYYVE